MTDSDYLVKVLARHAGKTWEAHVRFGVAIQSAMKQPAKIGFPSAIRGLYSIERPGQIPTTFCTGAQMTAQQIAAWLDEGGDLQRASEYPRTPEDPDPEVGTQGFS